MRAKERRERRGCPPDLCWQISSQKRGRGKGPRELAEKGKGKAIALQAEPYISAASVKCRRESNFSDAATKLGAKFSGWETTVRVGRVKVAGAVWKNIYGVCSGGEISWETLALLLATFSPGKTAALTLPIYFHCIKFWILFPFSCFRETGRPQGLRDRQPGKEIWQTYSRYRQFKWIPTYLLFKHTVLRESGKCLHFAGKYPAFFYFSDVRIPDHFLRAWLQRRRGPKLRLGGELYFFPVNLCVFLSFATIFRDIRAVIEGVWGRKHRRKQKGSSSLV